MSDESRARDAMLAAIRAALGVAGAEKLRHDSVANRLAAHPASLIPERAKHTGKARLELFAAMLESQGATVARVEGLSALPGSVAAYLRELNLPAELRTGGDELLAGAPWEQAPSLTRHVGRGKDSDVVALSRATAAAAETGTLFLVSGPENPTTLNFLPETHIVVIREGDILGSYEDAWDRLRRIYGGRAMPRTVNLISGPSRTADIEQIIIMGAHGPRRLHVIVVGGD